MRGLSQLQGEPLEELLQTREGVAGRSPDASGMTPRWAVWQSTLVQRIWRHRRRPSLGSDEERNPRIDKRRHTNTPASQLDKAACTQSEGDVRNVGRAEVLREGNLFRVGVPVPNHVRTGLIRNYV